MAPATDEPLVLVYDRIAQNRRKTLLLIALAAAVVVPMIALVSIGASLVAGTLTQCSTFVQWAVGIGTAVSMAFLMGLLFWSMASEPTSKLLSLMGARLPAEDELPARRLLENLSIGAGLPLPRFYVIDSLSPNAGAAGMDPAHSAVAVTKGLLELLDKRELEGVLAHELSHIGNRDTRLNTLVAAIALFLRIPYLLHQSHNDDQSEIPAPWQYFMLGWILLAPVRAYLFIIVPAIAALIRSAVSRRREFLADADAALLTRYPAGLMLALAKISGAGSMMLGANPSLAHLFFAEPSGMGVGAGPLAASLFDTHPPISDRIALLANCEGGVPESEVIAAVQAGKDFSRRHMALPEASLAAAQDELSVFTAGNPAGRACRLVGTTAPIPVYDHGREESTIVAHIMPGDLLVVFDDAGPMREVLTCNQTFGYLPRRARLEPVDMLPGEVFDPESRAGMMATLAKLAEEDRT